MTNVGGFAWGSVEGENVIIHTISGKTYSGTLLPIKASVHVYGDVTREMPRTEETMEIRIDEDVKTDQDVFKLGILQGDFVSLDPRTRVLENGYIKSRYLDDKLCVAQILAYLKYLKDNKQIGEVALVLMIGEIRYMERNIRGGIEHTNYFELRNLVDKLRSTDVYTEKEV